MSGNVGECFEKIWSKRIIRNTILFFPMLFIVTLISFAVIYYAPGDAATLLLRENLQRSNVTEEEARQYGEKIDIGGSFAELYSRWMAGVLKGDFGRSHSKGDSVIHVLMKRYKITLITALLSICRSAKPYYTCIYNGDNKLWPAFLYYTKEKQGDFFFQLYRICTCTGA